MAHKDNEIPKSRTHKKMIRSTLVEKNLLEEKLLKFENNNNKRVGHHTDENREREIGQCGGAGRRRCNKIEATHRSCETKRTRRLSPDGTIKQ